MAFSMCPGPWRSKRSYLLWPLAVLLLKRHVLMSVCIGLILISAVSRLVLWRHGASPIALYTLTFCRMDGLCTGAWLSLFVRRGGGRRMGAWPLAAAAGALCAWLAWTWAGIEWLAVAATFPAIAFATAGTILTVVRGHASKLNALLSCWSLRFLGRLSYALYLFHYPIMAILRDKVFAPHQLPNVWGSALPGQLLFEALGVLVSIGAAWISWNVYENPILRLKRFFPKRITRTKPVDAPVPAG